MRKYKAVLPETIAKEKEKEKEAKRRKKEKEKEKEKKKRKLAKERAKKKEKERIAKEKAKQKKSEKLKKERLKRKYLKKKKKLQEISKIKKAEREKLKRQKERELKKIKKQESLAKEAEKKRLKKEEQSKLRRKARNAKYQKKLRRKKKIAEKNKRYYEKRVRPKLLKNRIDNHDVPGTFYIVTAKDGIIKRKWSKKRWWLDALNVYNKMIDENHKNVICPIEQIASASDVTKNTEIELLLLKHVNPEVEDNISVFRDENGKIVHVTTDNEELLIALKQPWYVEEKFIVNNMNPLRDKQTAKWICENIIEKDLSINNLKKVFIWGNYIIFNGDNDFDFVIGKTEQTAVNLYMALFKKYENTDYIYFIGELDTSQVSKWTEKICQKTGWKNLKRGKHTYFSKSSPEIKKRIPTNSKSIVPTGSKDSVVL